MTPSILDQLGISRETISGRGLREYEEATELVYADIGDDGREHRLTPLAAEAWRAMRDEAASAGVVISIASSYRSVARQTEIVSAKLGAGHSIDDVLRSVAPPGYSEHHTGRAIDIVSPDHPDLDVSFAYTPAYEWLSNNARHFGFTLSYPEGNRDGYQYEPWHWCFQIATA